MSTGIQLVPLKCRNCGSALNAETQSLLLFCFACGAGYDTGQDLQPVHVYFAHPDAPVYFPFWAFDAQLHLKEREAKKALFGKPKGLAALFSERGTIRFYAPAFFE